MKVLVTSGATVPFERLIRRVLKDEVLDELAKQGYESITVQYGKGAEIFEESRSAYGGRSGIRIEGFDFTTDMAAKIREYDLVISHAGTGSILDALRANKRLITVVNSSLMDNHQAEIAGEFESQGYLISSDPDSLVEAVKKLPQHTFISFPPPDSTRLATILDHEAGIPS